MKITQLKPMFSALVLGLALSFSSTVRAAYTQAPPTGNDTTGAEFLITWNGSTFSLSAPSGQGPYDGIEDTLFGIQNNSSSALMSIKLSGPNIFGFDGDGAGSPFYNSSGPFGPTGYEGTISTTSTFNNSGTPDSFVITDVNNGTVVFGASGIPAGGSAWFSLEEHITNFNCGAGGCGVPDTGSTLSLLAIACAAGLALKRRFCKA
jgi:hypothetical protein